MPWLKHGQFPRFHSIPYYFGQFLTPHLYSTKPKIGYGRTIHSLLLLLHFQVMKELPK